MNNRFDVLGIGNAIVDILAYTSDEFLTQQGLDKGSMRLTNSEENEALQARIKVETRISGGSVANTMAALASLGTHGAYLGVVRDDHLGRIFQNDMTDQGVHFMTPPRQSGAPTARSLILITPDGERTMNTCLGICTTLGADDIDADLIERSNIVYLEGYLFDPPEAKNAFRKASRLAHQAGNKVALTLSDSFCVDRHREEFLDFIKNDVDILFANEAEIKSLYETATFEEACTAIRTDAPLVALTRGPRGAVIIEGEKSLVAPVPDIKHAIDLTGAGDLYAAGFLYGHIRNLSLQQSAAIGNLCAGEIISQIGARSRTPLREIIHANRSDH